MPRMPRWTLALIGAALLVGAPAVWWLQQPAESAGELPPELATSETSSAQERSAAQSPSPSPGDRAQEPSSAPDAEGDTPTTETDDAAQDNEPLEATTPRPAPPVAVDIPSIGVDEATVVDVALDERGAVEIPDDVREVGWYRRGPRPGEDGNAFMTSHVDSRTQGRGVLFDLRRTEPGDPITVTHADGTRTDWEVVRRERITKGSYPMEQVFRFDGPPGLVIDTCGGAFDPSTGSYENIDIIYAVPATP